MPYTPNTPADRAAMLAAVGATSLDDLLASIPADIRLKRALDVPAALTEIELTRHVRELAARNVSAESHACFLGGGAYDHFVPSVVDAIASHDLAQDDAEGGCA